MVSAVGAKAVGEKSVTAFSFLLARIRAPVLSDRDVYVSVNEQVVRALCENHRGLRVPVSPSTQTRVRQYDHLDHLDHLQKNPNDFRELKDDHR